MVSHPTIVLQMVIFVIMSSVVMAQKMSSGGNMNLVKEDRMTSLVLMVGEDVDLVCQVEQARGETLGNMKWSANGNMVESIKSTVTKAKGTWMKKSYLHLGNVTLDMDGMTMQCLYEEPVLIDGHTSHNFWPVEATLAVFTFSGENMGQYGGAVRHRMEQKIRTLKNIVDATPDLNIKYNNLTEVAKDKTQPAAPCSSAWKIERY